jgi:hypothetical protein
MTNDEQDYINKTLILKSVYLKLKADTTMFTPEEKATIILSLTDHMITTIEEDRKNA